MKEETMQTKRKKNNTAEKENVVAESGPLFELEETLALFRLWKFNKNSPFSNAHNMANVGF